MRRIALTLLATAALAGCGDDEAPERAAEAPPAAAQSESRYAEVAADAVREVEAGDAVLVDVRTAEEHAEGHAPEAVHLPLADIEAGERPDVAKDEPIFVYCRTGRRAQIAVDLLRRDGWTDVTNIGGLTDWQGAGGAVS